MKQIIFKLSIVFLFLFAVDIWANPLIIAHRGGKNNWPENTIYAFQKDKELGVSMIELDVQLTRDGIPVVYHKRDLSEATNGKGEIGSRSLSYIQKLNFNSNFLKGAPANSKIPTLLETLKNITDIPLIIDLKSLPAEPLIKAVVKTIPENEWKRMVFYSTNKEHLDWLKQLKPDAVTFEDRDTSRGRLLSVLASGKCEYKSDAKWIGFEMNREMDVVEIYALGQGQNKIDFIMWSPESIKCTHKMAPQAKIVIFGIDTVDDLKKVDKLGADAVLTNNPLDLV